MPYVTSTFRSVIGDPVTVVPVPVLVPNVSVLALSLMVTPLFSGLDNAVVGTLGPGPPEFWPRPRTPTTPSGAK